MHLKYEFSVAMSLAKFGCPDTLSLGELFVMNYYRILFCKDFVYLNIFKLWLFSYI